MVGDANMEDSMIGLANFGSPKAAVSKAIGIVARGLPYILLLATIFMGLPYLLWAAYSNPILTSGYLDGSLFIYGAYASEIATNATPIIGDLLHTTPKFPTFPTYAQYDAHENYIGIPHCAYSAEVDTGFGWICIDTGASVAQH